ncbi:MAG TPA: zinc ribbon domain-containing protein [Actinomycetota bacterium]|nr:zinc ribbon domain-containing protein [Actinomycetota bacterium]
MSAGGEGPRDPSQQGGPVEVPTFACPKCGHSVPVGTPICGNCGAILQGGTHVPEPLAASGVRPGVVITAALSVALIVAGFLAREQIKDAIDSVADTFQGETSGAGADRPEVDIPDIDIPDIDIGGGGGGGGRPRGQGGTNVGAIVRELRAAGIPCSNMQVQSADAYVATGSCQSNGQHVQINVYYTPETMAFAEDFYSEFAFASAHRDNWWISGETGLVRRIARALDARFQAPS